MPDSVLDFGSTVESKRESTSPQVVRGDNQLVEAIQIAMGTVEKQNRGRRLRSGGDEWLS